MRLNDNWKSDAYGTGVDRAAAHVCEEAAGRRSCSPGVRSEEASEAAYGQASTGSSAVEELFFLAEAEEWLRNKGRGAAVTMGNGRMAGGF